MDDGLCMEFQGMYLWLILPGITDGIHYLFSFRA